MAKKKMQTFKEWFAAQNACSEQGAKYKGLSFDRAYALLIQNFDSDADWVYGRLGIKALRCTCGTDVKCWIDYTPAELRRRYTKRMFRVALRAAGVRVPAPRKKVAR